MQRCVKGVMRTPQSSQDKPLTNRNSLPHRRKMRIRL